MCTATMTKHKGTQQTIGNADALHTIPYEILKQIVRPLSFQDKCSLEVLCQGFRNLLSAPLPSEKLWGKCDLMSDLQLDDRFNKKEDIMRWLS